MPCQPGTRGIVLIHHLSTCQQGMVLDSLHPLLDTPCRDHNPYSSLRGPMQIDQERMEWGTAHHLDNSLQLDSLNMRWMSDHNDTFRAHMYSVVPTPRHTDILLGMGSMSSDCRMSMCRVSMELERHWDPDMPNRLDMESRNPYYYHRGNTHPYDNY